MNYSQHTDQQIISKVIEGREDLYSEIITRYEAKLMRYILRLLNYHQQDSEDVLWEVFIKVYTNLHQYNPKYSFQSWIYRICHNMAIDYSKKNRRVHAIDPTHPSYTAISKEDTNLSLEYGLDTILNQLKPAEKQLLILHYVEGFKVKELSDMLEISPNSTSVKLLRAKNKARQLIKKFS